MSNYRITMTVVAILTSLLLVAGCSKPEEKVAKHLENIAEIMDDHKDKPKKGIEELREYVRDNLPAMAEAAAEAVVELDKIEDDKERVKRAEEMLKALEKPVKKVKESSGKFQEKVAKDKDAMKLMETIQASYMAVGLALGAKGAEMFK